MAYETAKFDDEIVKLLLKGGIGLLPSDTIYGLSGRALERKAVERLHDLKGRSSHKPFIILISDLKMLDLLSISKDQAKPAEPYWPGALSLEFQAPHAPVWLHRGLNHFAIRLPAYPELRQLIDRVGPLVSTSANLEGGSPVKTVQQAKRLFGDKLDFYLDVGGLDNPPSTLAVNKAGRLKVVRQGAVKIGDE